MKGMGKMICWCKTLNEERLLSSEWILTLTVDFDLNC